MSDPTLAGILNLVIMGVVFLLLLWKRKNLGFHINIFITAFGIDFATEIIAKICSHSGKTEIGFIYVIGILLCFNFTMFFYFFKKLNGFIAKKLQFTVILIFLINYTLSAIFIKDFFKTVESYNYLVNDMLMLASIAIFLYEVFHSDRILDLRKYFPFWISLCLIIIYVGVLPLIIVRDIAQEFSSIKIFQVLIFSINFIGYFVLMLGILFSEKTQIEN